MASDPSFVPASGRPDLEDFLGALSGFLGKRQTRGDDRAQRFLSMFCRSVGASQGQFIQASESGHVNDIASVGFTDAFNKEFADAQQKHSSKEPSPLDKAFQKKEVVAIVDFKKEDHIPKWFMKIMDKHEFRSLVAVPLMGAGSPQGVLSAYYHDVCLFDQNTIDHLSMVGRMMGAASEKSQHTEEKTSKEEDHNKFFDGLLHDLTSKEMTKIQLFEHIGKSIVNQFKLDGFICGPVRKTNGTLVMTVVFGHGVPKTLISHRISLPAPVSKQLDKGWTKVNSAHVADNSWGELKNHIKLSNATALFHPLLIQRKSGGALLGWRRDGFTDPEKNIFTRYARTASLGIEARG